jgi:hypothetical protein
MKYVLYTIGLFFICLFQVSFLNTLNGFGGHIDLVYILLFSYYLLKQDRFSLYLFFIGGIFIDFLSISQIGVTSADFFISVLAFVLITYIIPSERVGKVISILFASVVFFLISYITVNFLSVHDIRGIFLVIPWGIVNGIGIFVIANILPSLPFLKTENKIKIR